MKNFKEVELEELRLKILDALHSSKEFWITHRDNTYGLASILNLIYKKSYFEVLFFTKYDVTEKGLPPLKIYTPIKDEVDFSEIISNPDYDEDGLISPKKVIKRMKRIIRKEFQKHLSKLDEEVELLDEYFENYPINNNPYHRKIRISFNDFAISLKLNFERYPMFPSISFSQKLSSILSEKEFSTSPFVSAWDSKFPRHIIDIIDKIMELISLRLKIDKPSIESQYLILNNVSIGSTISDLNFKVLRGRSIGILFDEEEVNKPEHSLDLLHLFESISGSFHEFMGTLKIFGKDIQDLSSNLISKIFILPPAYDTEITSLKLKKALRYNINFDKILKEIDEGFKSIIAFAEIDQKLEFKIASLFSGRREIGFRKKKRIINNALDATGLRKKRINNLLNLLH